MRAMQTTVALVVFVTGGMKIIGADAWANALILLALILLFFVWVLGGESRSKNLVEIIKAVRGRKLE
jgi:hypothetical protein